MSWMPSSEDVRAFSLADARKEIERELKVREAAYDKWVADKKMTPEVAAQRYGALAKALDFLAWFESNETEVRAGFKFVRQHHDDPAVQAILSAFPGSKISGVRKTA